jgi:hypothetical protein
VRLQAFHFGAALLILPRLAKDGGAKEGRTPDLLNAIQALYQLSYDPIHETEAKSNFFAS